MAKESLEYSYSLLLNHYLSILTSANLNLCNSISEILNFAAFLSVNKLTQYIYPSIIACLWLNLAVLALFGHLTCKEKQKWERKTC